MREGRVGDVPVRNQIRPAGGVRITGRIGQHRRERQSGLRAENHVHLPVAEQRFHYLLLEVEWQSVKSPQREAMANVEEAVTAVEEPVARVLWNRAFAVASLLQGH